MRRKVIFCLLLAATTLVVYWPLRQCGFVDFDDPQYVVKNADVNHGLTWQSLRRAFTTPVVGNWHPVTTLSHILDCQLFGVNPAPQHMVNVALHIANACLLFLVLLSLAAADENNSVAACGGISNFKFQISTSPVWRCFFIAAIFALHPLRVESVAWISERKDVLSGFFFMLTLWAYAAYVTKSKPALAGKSESRNPNPALSNSTSRQDPQRRERAGERRPKSEIRTGLGSKLAEPEFFESTNLQHWHCYALALLFFACGLMSKPMLVTTPFLLLLLDVWPLRRFSNQQPGQNPKSEIRNPKEVRNPKSEPSTDQELPGNPGLRTLFLEKAPFFALSAIFSLITFFAQRGSGAVASLTSMSFVDRLDNAIVSYLRYLAKMVWPTQLAIIYPHPAAHFFPVDRWPEWQTPLIALLLAAVTALVLMEARHRPYLAFGWFWYVISMVPVIGLVQVGEQAMADRYTYLPLIGPVIALVWWVCELSRTGIPPASVVTDKVKSVSSSPATGAAQSQQPEHAKAWTPYLSVAGAIILTVCMIVSSRQVGYWRNTTSLFEHAVAVTGGNPSAQFSVGVGLEKEGLTNQAAVHYRVAAAIAPRDQQTRGNLAHVLRGQGFLQEAIEQYKAALAIKPSDLATEVNLAQTLSLLGKRRDAIVHFEAALRLDANCIEALNNLAWLLATSQDSQCRDGRRAVQLAERACQLTEFKETVLVGTLAAAYAEAGRFAEAAETASKACSLAAASGQAGLADKNQELLGLYRKGLAYHETVPQNHQ